MVIKYRKGVIGMIEDPFKEYIKLGNNTKKKKAYLWKTAIGLQDEIGRASCRERV